MNSKIALLLCAMTLVACGRDGGETETREPVVRVDTVMPTGSGALLQLPGRVVAATDANLAFKVAGTLRRVYVGEGSYVKAGQLVAELDDTDYKVQLSATKAEYAQVKADAERVIALYKEGGTTASNYDKARYGLEQMEAKLQNHTNQLKYTKLYAPYSGYVQQKFFDGNETVGAGMPVVALMANAKPEVEVNLPASAYVDRQNFCGYSCSMDVLPGRQVDLELISILPQANANQLYTMRLRMKGNNPQVAPGMSAWVSIQVGNNAKKEVRVPVTALVEKDGRTLIYVYDPAKKQVRETEVKTERLHTDGTVEVTGSGVKAGDKVVSAGAHHIKNGQRVKLLPPPSKTNVGGLL